MKMSRQGTVESKAVPRIREHLLQQNRRILSSLVPCVG